MLHLQHIPLSLYIHFPWCVQKCPYCDFNSHTLRDELPESQYITALLSDLEQFLESGDNRSIQTIFFGGGTPSLMSGEGIRQILDGVRSRVRLAEDAEITLEANPGTVDQAHFDVYREAGVNRLSIGAQSLRDDKLKVLGRIHGADQVPIAVETARRAGFENLNLDIMFGLPDDDLSGAISDLTQAINLQPDHLSWYQLTLEPNTLFYQRPPPLPKDDLLWEMQEAGQKYLSDHGYKQYEISAYANQNRFCQHNLNYWQFGDYIGLGAGAHSKLSTDEGEIFRYSRPRHPKSYLAGPQEYSEKRSLSYDERIFEYLLNCFRLNRGFTLSQFESTTGLAEELLREKLCLAEEKDLIRIGNKETAQSLDEEVWVAPTQRGKQYHNDLIMLFLPDQLA